MCGIHGVVRESGVSQDELLAMSRAISHRGPDDDGQHIDGPVGLGSVRLSIVDLPGGHQPICNEDESIWVVFNGEIYNHESLRKQLQAKGHVFRTRSDTEVIVHLYEERGESCVDELRGMFAFAIWDAPRGKLVLARDRLGQKPLYYTQSGRSLLFASEVKALRAVHDRPPDLDLSALHHYLSLRFIPTPQTIFQDVRKLPPAHLLVWQDGSIAVSRYWKLSFREKMQLDEPEAEELLREKLRETLAAHLSGDVEIGAFLSGGLDSGMIVAMLARDLDHRCQSFSVGVEDSSFNELPQAREVAQHLDLPHVEKLADADLLDLVPKMVWHLDEPSDPIALCMFHAAALAGRHVKVVLGGDGGDELFGGFDRYAGVQWIDAYSGLLKPVSRQLVGPLLHWLPESFAYKSVSQKLRWLHRISQAGDLAGRYAEASMFSRFDADWKRALYGDELSRSLEGLDAGAVITREYHAAEASDPLDRMLCADYATRLPEHTLMLTDRMTMAHGLEARSPYLDHELVELVASFPAEMKVKGRRLKVLLRRLARGYLPEAAVRRPKQGFMLPVAQWFRGELHPLLRRALLDSHFVRTGLFRREAVERLLDEHLKQRADHHVRLWMLLNLEVWWQLFGERRQPAEVAERLRALR
jgi:asparagine synthase (glutamine-hydrolysing)